MCDTEKDETKRMKGKDRRRDGILIIIALQATSLFLAYYLGKASKKR